jgi:hypothetical protein
MKEKRVFLVWKEEGVFLKEIAKLPGRYRSLFTGLGDGQEIPIGQPTGLRMGQKRKRKRKTL